IIHTSSLVVISHYFFDISCFPVIFSFLFFFFFFNDTATTEIYTLSLHDALPISRRSSHWPFPTKRKLVLQCPTRILWQAANSHRSEEHTSELQSPCNLVCRLLLEKKKKNTNELFVFNTSEVITVQQTYCHLTHIG